MQTIATDSTGIPMGERNGQPRFASGVKSARQSTQNATLRIEFSNDRSKLTSLRNWSFGARNGMGTSLRRTTFQDVDLSDPFFDSLKAQYEEFPDWFARKTADNEPVYVVNEDDGSLRGFVYLKVEEGAITDVEPHLPPARRIKVGTLKINAHGTKLGERVIKKVFDHALSENAEEIYVTVFDTHFGLINLLERYGFVQEGQKNTVNGEELVLVRSLQEFKNDIIKDFPFIHTDGAKAFILSIYPEYHTKLFPDSILRTEKTHIVEDVSHTNTIHKVYIGGCVLTRMRRGDIVVIYRTTDIPGRARYRSVATSVCVVEEARARRDFASEDDFVAFALPHSVFTEEELRDRYRDQSRRLYAIRMMYNVALPKRPNRDALLGTVGMTDPPRFDFRAITHAELDAIAELAELDPQIMV